MHEWLDKLYDKTVEFQAGVEDAERRISAGNLCDDAQNFRKLTINGN